MSNKLRVKFLSLFLSIMIIMGVLLPATTIIAESDIKTLTIEFPESVDMEREKTVSIPNLFGIKSAVVDNGEIIKCSSEGDSVTVKVYNGSYITKSHSMDVELIAKSSTNIFASQITYNEDGYIGVMYKVGDPIFNNPLYYQSYNGTVTNPNAKFYKYMVTIEYTENEAPIVTLNKPDKTFAVNAFFDVDGTVIDKNDGDEVSVYYSIDNMPSNYLIDKTIAQNKGFNFKKFIDVSESADGGVYTDGSKHFISLWAIDKRGAISGIVKASFIIDRVSPLAPQITVVPEKELSQKDTVTIIYPDDAFKKYYKIGSSGEMKEYKGTFEISVNGAVYAYGEDAAGNKSDITCKVIDNIDIIPPALPEIIIEPETKPSQKDTVKIIYPDDAVKKYFKIGEAGITNEYTEPFDISENTIVYARGSDLAGNQGGWAQKAITNIDKVPPLIPEIRIEPDGKPSQKDTVTILYPKDADKKYYKIGKNGEYKEYTVPFTISSNDIIYASAEDIAGNSSQASKSITNIDLIPPTDPQISINTQESSRVDTITIIYPPDAIKKYYKIGENGERKLYEVPFPVSVNGAVYACGEDIAGNIGDWVCKDITNIDTTPPLVPIIILSPETDPSQKDTVTIIYPEDAVLVYYKIGADGKKIEYNDPFEISVNDTVYATGEDKAGNDSGWIWKEVTNIDTTTPNSPEIIVSKDETNNEPIDVHIKVKEFGDIPQYSLSGAITKDWSAGNDFQVFGYGKTTIHAKSLDKAGNQSPEVSKEVIINSPTPTATPTQPPVSTTPAPTGTLSPTGTPTEIPTPTTAKKRHRSSGGGYVSVIDEPTPPLPGIPDLAVYITSEKTRYEENEIIEFTIKYKFREYSATNVIVSADVPEYTKHVDGSGGTLNGNKVEFKIDKLEPGSIGEFKYKVRVNELDKSEVTPIVLANIKCNGTMINTDDDESKFFLLMYSNRYANKSHSKFITGYEDNSFRAENSITRAEVATIISRLLKLEKSDPGTKIYPDVDESHWGYGYIYAATKTGLFRGYEDGTFHPDSYITRAEASVVIAQYLKLKQIEPFSINFSDIKEHWAFMFIEEIYRVKFIDGYLENNIRSFIPNANIKRSEAVTMFNNVFFRGPLKGAETALNDINKEYWAYNQVAEASEEHFYIRDGNSETKVNK